MKIIGAGMAGLLAANVLRRHRPVVYEARPSLPSNHSALLRFRNEGVSRVTGIPFKQVRVHKAIVDTNGQVVNHTNLKLNNMYAQKVVGRVIGRSSMNLDPVDRWIAPHDFVEQMAKCVDVRYGETIDLTNYKPEFGPCISTIPMPELMKNLEWQPLPEFKFSPVWVLTAQIVNPDVDVYQTIYFPDPAVPIYRASITGSRIIMEFIDDPRNHTTAQCLTAQWLPYFGILPASICDECLTTQRYGKISPIDDLVRKNFIYNASQACHIYSLGRFATWRQILLDDLIGDIQFIESFILQRDLYSVQKTMIHDLSSHPLVRRSK